MTLKVRICLTTFVTVSAHERAQWGCVSVTRILQKRWHWLALNDQWNKFHLQSQKHWSNRSGKVWEFISYDACLLPTLDSPPTPPIPDVNSHVCPRWISPNISQPCVPWWLIVGAAPSAHREPGGWQEQVGGSLPRHVAFGAGVSAAAPRRFDFSRVGDVSF